MKAKIVLADGKNALAEAVKALKGGKVIVYPTETSYGIGCDAENKKAVKKIHAIKKEPVNKQLIILVPSISFAKKITKLSTADELLAKKFMPGALTLVVQAKDKKIKKIFGNTVAFRISSNRFAFALTKKFGGAIVSTSANIHGQKPVFSAKKAIKSFGEKVDLIMDTGNLPKRAPSTIYDSKNKKILRKGKIVLAKLKNAFTKYHWNK